MSIEPRVLKIMTRFYNKIQRGNTIVNTEGDEFIVKSKSLHIVKFSKFVDNCNFGPVSVTAEALGRNYFHYGRRIRKEDGSLVHLSLK